MHINNRISRLEQLEKEQMIIYKDMSDKIRSSCANKNFSEIGRILEESKSQLESIKKELDEISKEFDLENFHRNR